MDETQSLAVKNDLSSLVKEDPHHWYNLISDGFRSRVDRIPHELLYKNEDELERELREKGCRLTKRDHEMRLNFWREYDRAIATGKNMVIERVYGTGRETRAAKNAAPYFYDKFLNEPLKVAFLVRSPTDRKYELELAANQFHARLYNIVNLAYETYLESQSPKNLQALLKLGEFLTNRVDGGVVQRVQQHNIHQAVADKQDSAPAIDMAEIDRQLLELRQKHAPMIEVKSDVVVEVESE